MRQYASFTTAAVWAAIFGLGRFLAAGQVGPGPGEPLRPPKPPPQIVVHGDGEVDTAPDQALVTLGAEVQSKEAAAAQNAVNAVMEKALSQITKLGVPAGAIQTAGLSLTPVYSSATSSSPAGPPPILAYRASNILQVKVNNLSLVGQVIDAGMAAGVNRLNGVFFSLRDDLPQRTAALRRAANEAQAKANVIAETLGVRIVGVAEVTEGGVNVIRPRQPFALRNMAVAAATPVEPGEVRVHANVTVRFNIAPAKPAGRAGAQGTP